MVDTEKTAKELLDKGKLKRRYTIIPLNKISSRSLSNDVIKKAQQLVSMQLVSSDDRRLHCLYGASYVLLTKRVILHKSLSDQS